jgi:hypothetical protein
VILAFIMGKVSGAWRDMQEELAKGMGPEIDEAAQKILDTQIAVWGGPHEYRLVDPAEFEGLDKAFYDDNRRWLEGHGFQFLADVENTTLTKVMPNLRTFLRVMAGDEGAVTAALYQARLEPPAIPQSALPDIDDEEEEAEEDEFNGEDADKADADDGADEVEPPAPRFVNGFELESELTDGTFLVTNYLSENDRMPDVEGVKKVRLPSETPPDELLAAHRQRVAEARASGSAVRALATFDEVMASQHRMHAIKAAHQRRIGFLDEETVSKIGGPEGNVFGDKIVARARELYAEKVARGEVPDGFACAATNGPANG